MNNYVMLTWSDPMHPEDKRQLYSWTYNNDFGWCSTKFNTEQEAEEAGQKYLEFRRSLKKPKKWVKK